MEKENLEIRYNSTRTPSIKIPNSYEKGEEDSSSVTEESMLFKSERAIL